MFNVFSPKDSSETPEYLTVSGPEFLTADVYVCIDHVAAEQLSEGICTVRIHKGNTEAEHREVSSPDPDGHTDESMNATSSSTRDTSTGDLTTAVQSVATSLIIPISSDHSTSSPEVDTGIVVNGVPPDSSTIEPVVLSTSVTDNPTGTCVYAFSTVSKVPSIVPAIVYPVTIASPTLTLRSSTEAVSDSASSSNPSFQEPDTTASVSQIDVSTVSQIDVSTLAKGNVPCANSLTKERNVGSAIEVSQTDEQAPFVAQEVSLCLAGNEPKSPASDSTGLRSCSVVLEVLKLTKDQVNAGYASEEAGSKPKPYRPCPYCHAYKSDLSDHITRKHADEDVVKRALSLPRYQRIRAFRQLKKEGIMKANMQILKSGKKESVNLLRERQPQSKQTGSLVYCSECHGFVSSKFFSRHRKNCMSVDASTIPQSMPTLLVCDAADNGDYKRDILKSFQQDAVGKLCVTDKLIVSFGNREFKTIRTHKDKQAERRTALKTKMRRLGTLYDCFKRKCHASSVEISSAFDMFKRTNFKILEDTIYTLTTENGDKVKNGLKVGFGYVLKSVCKYLHGEYLIQGKDDEATEIDRFLAVLNYHWASLFGDAEYANSIKRQEVLRKPQNLPDKKDIKTLRDFTLKKIQDLTDDEYLFVANTEYSLLRDLVVSRLTLFNARRGGEPSRLSLREWSDALNDVWYKNTETVDDPLEKFLLGRYKLAYQSGKRVKLVPLLIVDDCWKAIDILANPEIRKQVNVYASNRYVFPNTRFSTNHVSGWKAVEKCCQMAGLDNSITATQMRHYVATVYAGLEIPDEERKQFYEHMGHSEAINKNVYQSPLAVKEVIQVGGFLDRLDRGQLSETVSRRRTSSEGSTNDTTFTEMTPLSINENNGPDQQDVRRSDSCGIRQTGDPQETNNQKPSKKMNNDQEQADRCSEVSDIILTNSRNQAPFTSKSSDTYPESEKTNESEKVRLTTVSKVVKGQLSETVSRRRTSSEGSTNDTTFTEMTPLSNNECNGHDQQDVRSDSCGICQTGDPQETNNQKQADICSEVSDIILTGSRNQAPFTSKSTDTYPASEKTNESEKVCLTTVSKVVKDKLAAKLYKNQIHKERSAILPGSSRSEPTTPEDPGCRPKITFGNSYRDPDPQDMDYSDSGSSSRSTPTKKRIYRPWSTEQTKTIQKCFERYIRDASDIKGNTGPLPRADEVKLFMKQHPEILPDVTLTARIARIKTKVFNERKELRRKMAALEGTI